MKRVLIGLALLLGFAAGFVPPRRRRLKFAGQTIVITGGSRGLGFAMARVFARHGARVVLIARSADQLATAVAELRRMGAAATAFVCDIRRPEEVQRVIDAIVRDTGRIDVLVNNAGIIQMTPFLNARFEDFEDSLNTHFWGPLFLTEACLPCFLGQRAGQIVNIASVGGRVAVPHLAPYSVGKFALVALSDAMHAELAPYNIGVTTVTPYLMRTGSHRNVVVRGRHEKEATLFALATATPLTAISAERAAAQIVAGVARRQARLAPGWPSRAAEIAQAIAPGLTAAVTTAAVRVLLPKPSTDTEGRNARISADLDLGSASRLFATRAASRLNQRIAPDELLRTR